MLSSAMDDNRTFFAI